MSSRLCSKSIAYATDLLQSLEDMFSAHLRSQVTVHIKENISLEEEHQLYENVNEDDLLPNKYSQ